MSTRSYFDVRHAKKPSSRPLSSVNSSFSSNSDWDTCSMVDAPSYTPDMFYVSSFSGNSSEPSFLATNPFNEALLQPAVDFNVFAIPVYHEPEPYSSQDGLSDPAHIGSGYLSPMCSPQGPNYLPFITPLETTFSATDMQSPFTPNAIIESYNSPLSDYQTDYSFNDSPVNSLHGGMDCSMSPCSSVSYEPSLSSPAKSEKFRQRLPARSIPSSSKVKLEVLETSAALQGAQNTAARIKPTRHMQARTQQRKAKAVSSEKNFPETFAGNTLKRLGSRKHACNFSKCEKRFERTEHVKRHESTVHNPAKFACPFCPAGREKYFPKGRMDNYKDHLKRHTIAHKTRTNYHRDAQAELDSLSTISGKRTRKSELLVNVKAAIAQEEDGVEENEVAIEDKVLA